ncbi:MAG: hypothetical protein M0T70_06090 [Geobacteraceae bacterium]|nr:hypothetical protein [Geobacteraceae bacterium]
MIAIEGVFIDVCRFNNRVVGLLAELKAGSITVTRKPVRNVVMPA